MRGTNVFITVECENFKVCGNEIEIEIWPVDEDSKNPRLYTDASVNFDLVDSGWLVTDDGDYCEDCREEQEQDA